MVMIHPVRQTADLRLKEYSGYPEFWEQEVAAFLRNVFFQKGARK